MRDFACIRIVTRLTFRDVRTHHGTKPTSHLYFIMKLPSKQFGRVIPEERISKVLLSTESESKELSCLSFRGGSVNSTPKRPISQLPRRQRKSFDLTPEEFDVVKRAFDALIQFSQGEAVIPTI